MHFHVKNYLLKLLRWNHDYFYLSFYLFRLLQSHCRSFDCRLGTTPTPAPTSTCQVGLKGISLLTCSMSAPIHYEIYCVDFFWMEAIWTRHSCPFRPINLDTSSSTQCYPVLFFLKLRAVSSKS